MTKITKEDVSKVAKLSRIELDEEQLNSFTIQLEQILDYASQLEKVDTENTKPTARAVEVVNIMRQDICQKTHAREDLLDLSPQREGDFFRVPKIL